MVKEDVEKIAVPIIKYVIRNNLINTTFDIGIIIRRIVFKIKSGLAWRDVDVNATEPNRPSWNTYYYIFNKLSKKGVFVETYKELLLKYFKKQPSGKLRYVMTDTTAIYNKGGVEKIGRNKFFKNKNVTKTSVMSDTNGVPINIKLYDGNEHDSKILIDHLKNPFLIDIQMKRYFIADKGYDSDEIREELKKLGYVPIIPYNKRNTKDKKKLKKMKLNKKQIDILKQRHRIENTNKLLKNCRSVDMRYEKSADAFLQCVYVSCILLILNKMK